MLFVKPPLLVDWKVMHVQLIEDVISCANAPCKDRRVDFIEGYLSFFNQLCTLFSLFDPARREGNVSPSRPFFLFVPYAFSVADYD